MTIKSEVQFLIMLEQSIGHVQAKKLWCLAHTVHYMYILQSVNQVVMTCRQVEGMYACCWDCLRHHWVCEEKGALGGDAGGTAADWERMRVGSRQKRVKREKHHIH